LLEHSDPVVAMAIKSLQERVTQTGIEPLLTKGVLPRRIAREMSPTGERSGLRRSVATAASIMT
jgi:hypothetical protein